MSQNEGIRLLETLDSVWQAIRAAHPEVPPVLLLAAPSQRHEGPMGHFSALRWEHRTNGKLHEVVVFAEYLDQDPEHLLEILIHEAAHACNHVRGIKDFSANQYHNRAFKKTAEELGLEVERVEHFGFAETSLRPETALRFEKQVQQLGAEIRAFRRWSRRSLRVGVQTSSSRNLRASCDCGFLIRVARSTLAATQITCSQCRRPFRCA